MTGSWLIASVIAAVAASPLLASWSAALAGGQRAGWWHPRAVGLPHVWLLVAVTTAMVLLATPGDPRLAWWILAAGGAVLAVVDAQTLLLPARFTYPLAAAVGCALLTAAVIDRDFSSLLRAATAAVVIGLVWLGVRFISPPTMGLGDVRLAALTGGLLGWTSWATVWQGQVLIMLCAGITAAGLRIAGQPSSARRMQIPMGPAIIAGSLLALWL